MKENHTPTTVEIDESDSTLKMFLDFVEEKPDFKFIIYKNKDRSNVEITAKEFHERVIETASMLIESGIEPGDRVSIMAQTSYHWTLFDLAILSAGAVVVPIYETDSKKQVEFISKDASVKAIFTDTVERKEACVDIQHKEGSSIEHVWCINDGSFDLSLKNIPSHREEIDRRISKIKASDLFSIIYTSGTSGRPKGCRITHKNILFQVRNTDISIGKIKNGDEIGPPRITHFLPLAHALGRIGVYICINSRIEMSYFTSVSSLAKDIQEFKPTLLLAVPRLFEKMYTIGQQKAFTEGKVKHFNRAARAAISVHRARHQGRFPKISALFWYLVYKNTVYNKFHKTLGGRLTFCFTGGAPLSPRLAYFFEAVGIDLFEGWGMTETIAQVTGSAPISPERNAIGSAGPPLPGSYIRISDENEIETKGERIFDGYWNNDEQTRETFTEDGWLKSGDIGHIDEQGNLHITGRMKDMIITSGGKNIIPGPLEEELRSHALISEAVVIGDKKPFVSALICLDKDNYQTWMEAHDLHANIPYDEAILHPEIISSVKRAVDRANEKVSRAESIREFRIIDSPFSIENGTLTSTYKVIRTKAVEVYSRFVQDIYGDDFVL